jgi:pimeloyl-ACP methyl ester carboxylesterase
MKKALLYTLIFYFALLAQAQEQVLQMSYKGWTFEGTLLPAAGAEDIVLIIAGSGPTDRDGNSLALQGKNNSLKYLAEALDSMGIASLRYDKRGLRGQVMDVKEEDLRFDDFVDDALAWFRFLQQEKGYQRVHIAGHSEGSLIGMLAAQQAEVTSFISLAGSGLPLDVTIQNQLANLNDSLQSMARTVMDELKAGRGVPADQISPIFMSLFRPSVQPFLINMFQYDPAELLGALDIPVLIVQGGLDIQVPATHGERLATAKPEAEYVFIEDMNHVLKAVKDAGMSNQLAYINPDFLLHHALVRALAAHFQRD